MYKLWFFAKSIRFFSVCNIFGFPLEATLSRYLNLHIQFRDISTVIIRA